MRKLEKVRIKKLFSGYANKLDGSGVQYICESCNQSFSSSWSIRANPINPWVARGSYAYCSYCGKLHCDKEIQYVKTGEETPYEMELTSYEYKDKVVLKVKYCAFRFTDLYTLKTNDGSEVFTFDFASNTASFTKEVHFDGKPVESITIPLDIKLINEVLSNSVLRFIHNYSYALKDFRSSLIALMRSIREAVTVKIEQTKEVKIGSTYINALGAESGMLLIPMLNLANKMKDITCENLNAGYKTKTPAVLPTFPLWAKIKTDWVDRYCESIKNGTDHITGLIKAVGLPDKDYVRKMVKEDAYNVIYLKAAYEYFEDNNLIARFAESFKKLVNTRYATTPRTILDFVGVMLTTVYEPQDIVYITEKAKEFHFTDWINLYAQLNDKNKEIFRTNRLKLRDIHDWMSIEHKKQKHENITFNTPDHIVKRLSMQYDRMKFFLPKESVELLKAGHTLKNCVASYANRVKNGSQYIVIVGDEKGKYTACLRVIDNCLVEAKINQNKPVANDALINQTVIDWALRSNLKIDTSDVRIEPKKMTRVA